MMSLISISAKSFTDVDIVAKFVFCGFLMLVFLVLKSEEERSIIDMLHYLLAGLLFIFTKYSIWNNDNSRLHVDKNVVKPKKQNKKKEAPPPVLDDKKKKNKKNKRSGKKIISKENKEPTASNKTTKMYDSINACQMLNMTQKDIYQYLYQHILSETELRRNRYPSENYMPRTLVSPDCDSRLCARCGMQFEIYNGMYLSTTNCRYHPKKAVYDPDTQIRVHPCCKKITGEEGCTDYIYHVTIQHGPKPLTKTASRRHVRKDLQHRVFSLDCEMSYTTAGLEVTRIGLVDIDGLTVYDSYVKPKNQILDYNTQYSGVEKRHLEHVSITLDDVKQILSNIIHEDTILVGHALNNDLAALGLIHKTVVDTSVLYLNESAPYYKKSLKSLAFEYLDLSIQNDPAGHNCIDDARACLQLALLKVPKNPPTISRPLAPMENLVKPQPFVKNQELSVTQQPMVATQNISYIPLNLSCHALYQEERRKSCFNSPYNNPPISFYTNYAAVINGYF